MLHKASRCVLCGQTEIDTKINGRFVTTSCPTCLAVFMIEFDPPDHPELRARIERLDDTDEGKMALARMPEVVHVAGQSFRVRSR